MLDLKAIGERARKIRGKLSQYEFADKYNMVNLS